MKLSLSLSLLASALLASPAFADTFTATIDAATYNGATGSITFNDHGYTGPNGVGANDFQVGSGFDASRIGQIQNVVTKDPDWQTSDPAQTVLGDFGGPEFANANLDGAVNFYAWAYTTVGGSKFSNMTIDQAGNYFVAKDDMKFKFYDTFQYTVGTTPVSTYDTVVNFQPYAVSDAKGWCGSVLVEDPNSLSRMAGQVTFDFAFDAYLWDGGPVSEGGTGVGSPMTQIVPGFVMRSYGSYVVDVTKDGILQHFEGSAVENNTNPVTGELDPAFQNRVSFLGAGVVPAGVWVLNDGTPDVQVVAEGTPGATWHVNGFGGYAFLLRADGERTLFYINPEGHSDYVATVPEADTWAMMLAGMGLVGAMAARRRRSL